jgi:hypothetical protein
MPYPDETMTTDEHVAEAKRLAATSGGAPSKYIFMIQAINGLTHAVLALVANQEARRAEGQGW